MVIFSLDDLGEVLTSFEGLDELVSLEGLALPEFPELLEDLTVLLLSLEGLDELTPSLEDLEVLLFALEDLVVFPASLEDLEVLTASLDLPLLLLLTLLPASILLEVPLFTEPSLLDMFELLSECTLE